MSPFRSNFRFVFALLLAGLAFSARAAELPAAFTAALKQAGIPLDHVAVVIQAVDAPLPRLSHNADAAMNPASVMKLVTSWVALAQLGPAYTWTTEVWANGVVRDGRLEGDLVIKGNGDPTLTLERIWLMQRELRAHGIREIHGDLLLDSRYFDLPPPDPGAFDGEPLASYNAAPGPLLANFNTLALRLAPVGGQVTVMPEIALPGVTFESRLVPDDAPCNGWKDRITPSIPDPARHDLVLEGRYARACGEKILPLNLFEPAATFDLIFRALWAEAGGVITGSTVPGVAPDTPPLLRFASVPLADALTSLNKFSNNVMTRNLFLTLGAQAERAPATLEKGQRAVRAALAGQGIDTRKLVLENGSGLSRIERVSAKLLTQLLLAAWRHPNFSEFESALPILAIDGTLKNRFNGSPLAGQAHLKTGSLRDARALAGYVLDAGGKRLAFVMLINHANAEQAEPAQRILLEWAQANGSAAP